MSSVRNFDGVKVTAKCFDAMIADEIKTRITGNFPFTPTDDQRRATDVFACFVTDREAHSAMILRGSAGTGKTSLASGIVKTLVQYGQKVVLLAPTGRAAKVFALNSGHDAFTIHRSIYRQKSGGQDDSAFNLGFNALHNALFIVDECSMISNSYNSNSVFGSGRLLDDLVQFVYSGTGCRLLLVGDGAQLPPVGDDFSPALSAEMMSSYGLKVYEANLDEVLRQSRQSGILMNATAIREMISRDESTLLPKITLSGYADICVVNGDELIESLASSYAKVGIDETMVVSRSNKRANIFNMGIRNQVLGREEQLTTGDLLMVVKNKYLQTPSTGKPDADRSQQAAETETQPTHSFIANGDRAMVVRIRNWCELYGFNFADVLLRFPDYDDFELQTTVIIDSLFSEAPALTGEQQQKLYVEVMADYADIPQKQKRMKALREDKHYNAVQIKYGYAVTCHKAQGGQWAHVYLDQGYMTDDMLGTDYLHWLYTAFTRATEKLFLVNWPDKQLCL